MANKYHARSISLPSRSHPSTISLEEGLNKLKTWQGTFDPHQGLFILVFPCLKICISLDEIYIFSTWHQPNK